MLCIVRALYDQYMVWHRKHRGRLCACYFFVAGWVVAAYNKLDGELACCDGVTSQLLVMSAWYVLLAGAVIIFDLFYRLPHVMPMFAWGFFASGLFFWATVVKSNWALFALSGVAGLWQFWVLSGNRHDHKMRKRKS